MQNTRLSSPHNRHWQPVLLSDHGYINFGSLFDQAEQICALAKMRVCSPRKQNFALGLGSDDQMGLWLNGRGIYEHLEVRSGQANTDAFQANLEAGWNTLLACVNNTKGHQSLYLRFADAPPDRWRVGIETEH